MIADGYLGAVVVFLLASLAGLYIPELIEGQYFVVQCGISLLAGAAYLFFSSWSKAFYLGLLEVLAITVNLFAAIHLVDQNTLFAQYLSMFYNGYSVFIWGLIVIQAAILANGAPWGGIIGMVSGFFRFCRGLLVSNISSRSVIGTHLDNH